MTNKGHPYEGETVPLAGVAISPRAASPGDCVILPFPALRPAAAYDGPGEDDGSDCWEAVGTVAVRMVARWSLPFFHCESKAAPDGYEEEGNHREP